MANFFSRPELTDLQFKQHSGDTLNLSGSTKFRSISGLTLSDGVGGDIVVTASGASTATTQLHVLTYIDGSIKLQPSSVSGSSYFACGCSDITRTPYGNLNMSATTVNDFLENFFFPAVAPSASLSISPICHEFGDNLGAGSPTISYSAIKETYPISYIGVDVKGNKCDVVETLPSCSGTLSRCVPACADTSYLPPTGCTVSTSLNYYMCVCTTGGTGGECITDTATAYWRNLRYCLKNIDNFSTSNCFENNATPIYSSGSWAIKPNNLTVSRVLSTSILFNNEFFYYVYPYALGAPNSVIVNGLPNNAWGDVATGTLYDIIDKNQYGRDDKFYVVKSDSRITGTFNIKIT